MSRVSARTAPSLVIILACLLGIAPKASALAVVIVPDLVNPPLPTDISIFNAAAANWERSIQTNFTVTITLARTNLPIARLGQASLMTASGIGNTGRAVSAKVTINDLIPFFVDPTPGAHEEFLNNVSPPYLRPADPSGPAFGLFDLYTVAVHEVGHAIGFSSSYTDFAVQIVPATLTPQNIFVFLNVPRLLEIVFNYNGPVPHTNGGVYMPMVEEDSEEGGSVGGLPSHIDDQFFFGTEAGNFSVDVMHPTLNQSERILPGPPDLDILADAFNLRVKVDVPTLHGPALLVLLFGMAISGAVMVRNMRGRAD